MRSPYEIKAHKELLEEGWMVDFKIRPRMCPRGYKVDYFGAFDLIAVHPKFAYVRWISIKGTMGVIEKHKAVLRSIPLPAGSVKEAWNMTDSGKWRKQIIT